MSKRRTYKKPPITEAIVEFRFSPRTKWPDDIRERLKTHPMVAKRYSDAPEVQSLFTLSATVSEPAGPQRIEQSTRLRLVDPLAAALTVGDRVLSVSSFAPYEGWERLGERAREAIVLLGEVAPEVELDQVIRVGLRYVNQISVKETQLDLDDVFTLGVLIPRTPKANVNRFFTRIETTLDGPDGIRFIFGFASLPSQGAGGSSFVLDYDFFIDSPSGLPSEELWPLLDRMHQHEGAAFENSITDKLRSIFDE